MTLDAPADPPHDVPTSVGPDGLRVTIGRDWHAATVDDDPDSVVRIFTAVWGAEARTITPPRGYGYRHAVGIYSGDDQRCSVLYSPDRKPFVVSTGYDALAAFDVITKNWGVCPVARTDAALDVYDEDAFDLAVKSAKIVAKRLSLATDVKGDWLDPGSPKGRTLALGSRSSEIYVRIYEFKKYHGYGADVRIEVEYKPHKRAAKIFAGTLAHTDIYRLSRAAVEIATSLYVPNLERLKPPPRPPITKDLERCVDHMLRQYGPLLERLVGVIPGGSSELGRHLLARNALRLEHHEDLRKARAAANNSAFDDPP